MSNLPATTDKPKLADLVKQAFGGDHQKLIALAKAAAISTLGVKADMTPEEHRILDANSDHLAAVNLGGMSGGAMIAFRNLTWGVFWGEKGEGKFQNVVIPIMDEATGEVMMQDGKPVVKRFEKFEEWWDFTIARAKVNQTADSTNYGAITILMKYLKNSPITVQVTTTDSEGVEYVEDRVITIDDILTMEEAKLEIIMAGVRKLLADYTKDKDKAHLTKVGTMVIDAQTLSRSELKKKLSAAGLRGTQVNVMPTFVGTTPDGKHTFYTIIANPSQEIYLNNILDGRLDVHSVEADDLPDILSRAIKDLPQSAAPTELDDATISKTIDAQAKRK